MAKNIIVSAGIITKDTKVLLAQRREPLYLRGKWEFPGGKKQAGEGRRACLVRELEEEFGIKADIGRLFYRSVCAHQTAKMDFCVYLVPSFHGKIKARVHSCVRWVAIPLLLSYDLLEADIPVAEKLSRGIYE